MSPFPMRPCCAAAAAALAQVLAMPALADVSITGLDGAMLDNALIHVGLDDEPCDAPGWRVAELFTRVDEQIDTALEAFGYYSAEVSGTLEQGESCWHATFSVDPGEPVRLRDVRLAIEGEAREDPRFRRLLEVSTLEPGETLNHAAYEQLKRRLTALGQERGYAEARFTVSRIDVYPQALAADIALEFDSGPRYAFGPIEIEQDVLARDIVEGFFEFRRGDPYDRTRLAALYGELSDSGYFESVDVRPMMPDADTRTIPVSIVLTGVTRYAINYGVGFSTDTGPRFRFGRVDRRVNARGTQSNVNGQLSPVISEVSYGRRLPFGDPRTDWVSFDVGVKHEETDTSVSDTLEGGVRRVQARRAGWQETQFVDVRIEDFTIGEIKSRSRLLTPGIAWLKIDADNNLYPTRGFRTRLELSGAHDSLGSDTTFTQAEASVKWIHSFANRSRILLRAQLGFTWVEDFTELPPSVRFFAGGDSSVRGFQFRSLGPVDENGDVVGGDRLAVASAEYELPFSSRWSGAVFVDSGNAFTGSNFEARTGAGFGLRWRSPLGPIRFDVAWPVNDVNKSPRLHISLGADL